MAESSRTASAVTCGEWVGAITSWPSYVTGEGTPYRPDVLVWVEADTGLVVGSELMAPGEALGRAEEVLARAMCAPMAGAARVPVRVRVDTQELADALRGLPIEIVCAPTPEIDAVIESMRAHLERPRDEDDREGVTYLGPELTPEDVRRFFEAAARLYRAKPWDVVPPDMYLSVACEALGITDGAMTVVGQQGQAFGWVLFRTHDDVARYVGAIDEMEGGGALRLPEHMMFSYDARDDLEPPLVAEIDAHGWPVAGPNAYPQVIVLDDDRVARGLTRDELAAVAAIETALAEWIEHEPGLARAWETDEPVRWRSSVVTDGGTIVVGLGAPCWPGGALDDHFVPEDAARATIVDDDGLFDDEGYDDYRAALLARFTESAEGTPFTGQWAELFVEYAAQYRQVTITGITPRDVRDVLFVAIPKHAVIDAEAGPEIIAEVKALLAFAARELGSGNALRALESIAPDAAPRLTRALATPALFAPAKALVMEGIAAGFDMTTEAGINGWLRVVTERQDREAPPRRSTAKVKPKPKARPTTKPTPKAKARAKPKARPAKATKRSAKPKATPRGKATAAKSRPRRK